MNGRALAKVLKSAGHLGGLVPGISGALAPLNALARQAQLSTSSELKVGKREVHKAGAYRVVVWLERGFATPPHIYVAVERNGYFGVATTTALPIPVANWQHVRTWGDVQVAPAPWYKPWRRKHELVAVIETAITFVDQQENLETTAEATLEAVTEAMRLT